MKDAEYEERIRSLDWIGLRQLYSQIEARDTPGWEPGRAFEYLISRAFELDGATRIRWPYEITLHGHVVEQVDGAVEAAGLYCLRECKNQQERVAIAPLAKMRNQLLRRPAASVGLIFSTSGYTEPAQVLAGYLGSQTILLWYPQEIELALDRRRIVPLLALKYRICAEEGDHNVDTSVLGAL